MHLACVVNSTKEVALRAFSWASSMSLSKYLEVTEAVAMTEPEAKQEAQSNPLLRMRGQPGRTHMGALLISVRNISP